MMSGNLLRTVLVSALIGACAPAAAVEGSAPVLLAEVEGSVLVNTGERFVNVSAPVQLGQGDRVLVMTGAAATLNWADGCALPLQAESMLTVGVDSPCAGAVAEVTALGPMTAQNVETVDTTIESEAADPAARPARRAPAATGVDQPNTWAWAVFGVGGAVAIAALSGGSSTSSPPPPPPPVSP